MILKKLFKLNPVNLILAKHYATSIPNKSPLQQKLNVVFFGTDLFSTYILNGLNKLLANDKINEINVITSSNLNPKSVNEAKTNSIDLTNFRGNQIINFCQSNKIRYYLWSDLKQDKAYLNMFKDFHVGVVASFGHLIPSKLIELFPL